MPKEKTLKGLAHDIAHHAASGLSYLNPHLFETLDQAGKEEAVIELLAKVPYPEEVEYAPKLSRALQALHTKVLTMLKLHGFKSEDIASVKLFARPVREDDTGYSLVTRAIITSVRGRTYTSRWIDPV